MTGIPRGVAGEGGRVAVVHDRQGTLIALDLGSGAVLWRTGRGLRPCALVTGSVVAVRFDASPALVIVLLDAADGSLRWTAPPVALPPWARPTLDDSPGFALSTAPAGAGRGDGCVISWMARSSYLGGAPPGRGAAVADQEHEAHGAVRVDPGAPSVEPLPGGPEAPEAQGQREAPGAEAEPDRAPEPGPGPGPLGADVLDACLLGGRRLELAVPPGGGGVVLRSVEPRTDEVVWEVVLDEAAESRPRKLRP
ncbi:PQQ-binding-like beta-propeller repeat protein [Streptomyces sp. NPDC047928]|uniref:outer membrane protein assembly factor BamB family protein n=1 Tax=unclassified Streptomyces TaxID=2593676 RepID=UPI003721D8AB